MLPMQPQPEQSNKLGLMLVDQPQHLRHLVVPHSQMRSVILVAGVVTTAGVDLLRLSRRANSHRPRLLHKAMVNSRLWHRQKRCPY
jgi:hypothetical protein